MTMERPTIGISMGDPCGIGPEVVVKALMEGGAGGAGGLRGAAHFRVYGSLSVMNSSAREVGVEPFWAVARRGQTDLESVRGEDVVVMDDGEEVVCDPLRRATARGGVLSFQAVEDAIADAKREVGDGRRLDGIVTAPISKEAWSLAGQGHFPGHTELLAARFGAGRVRMMFVAPMLKTMLVTAHIPLMSVAGALSVDRIYDTIELGAEACAKLGIERARIAVCGLNPHAGEAGLLGDEDAKVIAPAIERARERGIEVSGPWPGDTVYHAAVKGKFDLVVAMYHDQGLIPVKLLAFDRAVNVSMGLPTVRTSPDHGTAFDIAGTNRADAGSMRSAIELAVKLCAGAIRDRS